MNSNCWFLPLTITINITVIRHMRERYITIYYNTYVRLQLFWWFQLSLTLKRVIFHNNNNKFQHPPELDFDFTDDHDCLLAPEGAWFQVFFWCLRELNLEFTDAYDRLLAPAVALFQIQFRGLPVPMSCGPTLGIV